MKLPNNEKAYIPPAKLIDYLLSETHSVGKAKAKLLRSVGFNEANVQMLKEGLLEIAHTQDVVEVITTPHGVKYVINGEIETPVGLVIKMRTIWIIDNGQERLRFVTAYPL
jgi:hypothetical protein